MIGKWEVLPPSEPGWLQREVEQCARSLDGLPPALRASLELSTTARRPRPAMATPAPAPLCPGCRGRFPAGTEHGGRFANGREWSCGPGGYRQHGLYRVLARAPWWRRLLRWRVWR